MRTAVLVSLVAALAAAPAAGQAVEPDAPVSSGAPVEAPATATPAQASAGYPGSGLPERAAPPRTLRAHWHVYVAFAVAWLLLFGYALWVGRRFGRLEDEVRRLRASAG